MTLFFVLCWQQGYAYIEFLEPDAVTAALALDESEIRARKIKVAYDIYGLGMEDWFTSSKLC